MIEKKDIINLLEAIADMLEFRGENTFKVNAYRFGAVAIRKLEEDINEIAARKELGKIKGIGKGLEKIIYDFIESGYSPFLEELKEGIPEGVGNMMKIKGLGPRKINVLFSELNVKDLDDLEKAANEGKVAPLKGFGEALQAQILEEVFRIRQNTGYLLLNQALDLAEEVKSKLQNFKAVKNVHITGDLKRGREVINLIEFLVEITDEQKFEKELKGYVNYEKQSVSIYIINTYVTVIKVHTSIKFSVYDQFILTGSSEFISKITGIKSSLFKTDEDIFKAVKLPYVIPEMREVQFFEHKKNTNSNLEREYLRGLMHFHTTYSDGRNTLVEMLTAAKSKNFEYAFVCDHSQSAYYVNGLKEDLILLQNKEIAEYSSKLDFPVWQGIESDITSEGNLDYNENILKNFKLIVASIHSRFKMNKKEMTARIIKAVENPYTDILGHPSGRLLLMRDPYEFDVHKVLDACSRNRVAVEINANPRRLDLDWRYVYYAREKGCFLTINSDAHSITELDLVKYGVMMGRKAGLLKEEVINCFDKENFIKFLNVKRQRL